MWTSTLEISLKRVLPTQILGLFWPGAYFSSLAPLQMKNLPRQPLARGNEQWVRVHNRLAGICGSDLHMVFTDGDLRISPAALPMHGLSYPGHEVVGEVIEIGEYVQNLHVGDRVVLQSGPSCLSIGVQPPCRPCAMGNYTLCENANLPGPRQIGGGWSEEMLLHEQQLFRVPDEIEDEQAVLLEPAAVALHAVLRRVPQAGEKVLVVGAGTIGLLTLQVLRALMPQAEIHVMARHDFQIEQATRLGAAIIYERDRYENVRKTTGARLYTGMLGNKTLLGGFDVIYDTIGKSSTLHDCLRWARAGGTVVLVGVNLHPMRLDLSPVWHQEVNLIGSAGHGMEYWPIGTTQRRQTFAIAADLIANGLIHPEKLITHHFPLSNFREALQTAANKQNSRAIKVVFDAALLPASSIPTTRANRPLFSASDLQIPPDSQPGLIPSAQEAPATGPSHFTMAQSEDFTADFDEMQFVNPKARRPPTPLQFRYASEDAPETPRSIGPTDATNPAAPTFEQSEEDTDTSIPTPQDKA